MISLFHRFVKSISLFELKTELDICSNGLLLWQAIEICLRLHDSKTNAVVNTAAAAIRQCTSAVFDHVMKEGPVSPLTGNAEGRFLVTNHKQNNFDVIKICL